MNRVRLVFEDGESLGFDCAEGETILAGARRHKVSIASSCEIGDCQTCRGQILTGTVAYDQYATISLDDSEVETGAVLCCVATPCSEVAVRLPYTRTSLLTPKPRQMRIMGIEKVSPTTIALEGEVIGLDAMAFYPGQFVNISVPNRNVTRSYSMANAPGHGSRLEFLIRLLKRGAMSEYLLNEARDGQRLEIYGPSGVFYLRDAERPVVFVAGGTGLAPILSMIRDMAARRDFDRPVTLCFGVTTSADLFYIEQIEVLRRLFGAFDLRVSVAEPDESWKGRTGFVTQLLTHEDARKGGADIYLCGPPAMIDAGRKWALAQGIATDRIFAEQFVPSGACPQAYGR